MDHMTSTV